MYQTKKSTRARHTGVALALGACMNVATAQMAPPRDESETRREEWAEEGIALRADYVSESFRVTRAREQGTRYAQQIRTGVDLDLAKLTTWASGSVHITLNDRAGRGVSGDLVGNRLPIQEVYSSQFAKLTELSYDRDVFSHRGNVKVGLWSMGNDFGGLTLLCELVNAAFCAHPLAMSGGSGWGNYPNARWGVRLKYTLHPGVDVRVATFAVNPGQSTEAHAFSLKARGTTGAMLPLELDIHSVAPTQPYAGELKLGGYLDTSRVAREGETGRVSGRYGFYAIGSQKVFHEPGDARRGLTMAAEWMWADRRSAQITRWYSLDAVYQGTFPNRPQDTVALGYVRAVINPRLTRAQQRLGVQSTPPDTVQDAFANSLPNAEAVVELSYGWRVNRWFLVRPDIQYVMDPGAFSYRHEPDAVAVGVQLKATF